MNDNDSHIEIEEIKIEPAFIYDNNYWIKKNIEQWYKLFIYDNKRGNPTQLTEGIIKNKQYIIEKNENNNYELCGIIIDMNDVIYL